MAVRSCLSVQTDRIVVVKSQGLLSRKDGYAIGLEPIWRILLNVEVNRKSLYIEPRALQQERIELL